MDNYYINPLPLFNNQHDLEANSVLIVQTIWDSESVQISLFPTKSKSTGFTGTIKLSQLSNTADLLEINFVEFMEETRKPLTTENGLENFTYCLDDNVSSFKWCKNTGGFNITYGSIALEARELQEELLLNALRLNKIKDEKIEQQKQKKELMVTDYNQMKMTLEKCIEEKNILENHLITKFAALLNSKKEKIAELERTIKRQPVEDYESGGSGDDSDLDYFSQSYVVPVPSTSRQDDVVLVPKRVKPTNEKTTQELKTQRAASVDSLDVYDRETEMLIDEM